MTFIWPVMLFLLLLVPLLVFVYIKLQQKRRRRFTSSFGDLGFTETSSGKRPGIRQHIPPTLFLLGLTVLIFALARPVMVLSLPKEEGTIILAFDASGSMAADDIKPTRMEAAKAAVKDFVQSQPPSVQIGVVGFSDSGFSVQVPTNDKDAINAAINRLAPLRGTSLGQGIRASLNTIIANLDQGPLLYSNRTPVPTPTPTPMPKGTYTNAAIILLSDGENNEQPDPLAAAQIAANQGVRIYTVGLGSPAGTTVHINGFYIHTQLDEDTLKQIAQITNGAYYNAQNQSDLRKIYNNINSQLVIKPEKTEITALLAVASIMILLVGNLFSMLWFNRLL
jgi:Ca-activated chloride channel homolog